MSAMENSHTVALVELQEEYEGKVQGNICRSGFLLELEMVTHEHFGTSGWAKQNGVRFASPHPVFVPWATDAGLFYTV